MPTMKWEQSMWTLDQLHPVPKLVVKFFGQTGKVWRVKGVMFSEATHFVYESLKEK
jgi:hypothetical protein